MILVAIVVEAVDGRVELGAITPVISNVGSVHTSLTHEVLHVLGVREGQDTSRLVSLGATYAEKFDVVVAQECPHVPWITY